MFSWICPQCGRDVPPSKTDCPFCAEQAKEAAAAPPPVAPEHWQQPPQQYSQVPQGYGAPPAWQQPPQQPQAPPPPQPPQYAPPQPQYAAQQYAPPQPQQPPPAPPQYAPPPPQQYAPPRHQGPPPAWQPPPARSGPPPWLVAIGFAAVLLLVGGGIWFFLLRPNGGSPAEKAGLENPADASRQKVSNPLQKYVEVVGMRMINENKKPVAKFVVVNHSSTEIDNLEANVTLWASTSRSEEDSVGSFSFKIPELGPNDSKDLTEPLKTKFKMYELPDWQNTTAEIQITSPAP